MFNEVFLCNLTNFHNPDPSVDINANYNGRIQCSVTESYNKASICFTMGVKTSDAGVYDARLFKDSDEFITNNTLYVKGKVLSLSFDKNHNEVIYNYTNVNS